MNQNNLEEHRKNFFEIASKAAEQMDSVVFQETKNLIDSHTNQVRNIGLIAGVVAPLSLSLLQTDGLGVNTWILLFGFIILLGCIVYSQALLSRELNKKDGSIISSRIKLMSLNSDKKHAERDDVTSPEGFKKHVDIYKGLEEVGSLLGVDQYSKEMVLTHASLMKYSKTLIILFSIGCGLIALSVFINPVIEKLRTFEPFMAIFN